MCKVIDEYKVAYEDFRKKTQAQNVIIESLELQRQKLETKVRNLECRLENKKTLISLYEKDMEEARRRVERERQKFNEWKLDYKLRWKWGAACIGVIILLLEIRQLMLFMG